MLATLALPINSLVFWPGDFCGFLVLFFCKLCTYRCWVTTMFGLLLGRAGRAVLCLSGNNESHWKYWHAQRTSRDCADPADKSRDVFGTRGTLLFPSEIERICSSFNELLESFLRRKFWFGTAGLDGSIEATNNRYRFR